MKLAAISDIHGNIWALEAVLADIAARGIAVIVNLGDILSGPLEPCATAERLMALHLPTIRGNHERQLLEDAPAAMGPSDAHTFARLGPGQMAWLKSLPPVAWLNDDVFLCHGTPHSDLVYFLEEVDATGAHAAPPDVVEKHAHGIGAGLILCGHSHKPRTLRLADGRLVVNPGSVGLQAYGWDWPRDHIMEAGTPHARYAVIEKTPAGWQAEFVAVAYDWEKAAATADANGRPEWALALRTGRIQAVL
jgi:predicted phosphodiesterase